jgi:isocitrate dehydrogenase
MYWAQTLAAQDEDTELKEKFATVANTLEEKEAVITEELLAVQGDVVNIGGYYHPDPVLCEKAMRPSETFNSIIDNI